MDALDILNKFIDSGSPPDALSREWPDGSNPVIHFAWSCGTRVNLPYEGKIYDAVWKRFQEFWRANDIVKVPVLCAEVYKK